MTIYVDEIRAYKSGKWCHMATDGDIEELHQFAQKIGLKRAWFQTHRLVPHYDLRTSKRNLAIEQGAVEVTNRQLLMLCRVDGKREIPKDLSLDILLDILKECLPDDYEYDAQADAWDSPETEQWFKKYLEGLENGRTKVIQIW